MKEKLTPTQKNYYEELVNKLETITSCKNFEEYLLKVYELEDSGRTFEEWNAFRIDNGWRKFDEERWELAKENKVWGFYNSNSLRALERKGYIEICEDGKEHRDIIKIL